MASEYIGGGVSSPVIDSTQPHTSTTELPPPIQTLQPPASNAGSDDPSGGLAKDAGGLSKSAGIGSPVPAESQTVVGSVLEYAFGKKERTAEEVDAALPTTSSVLPDGKAAADSTSGSGTYLGAITGAAAAGGAAVASYIPGMSSTTEAEHTPVTTEKTLGEQASEATESSKVAAADAAASAQDSAAATAQSAKAAVSDDKPAATEAKSETKAEEKAEDNSEVKAEGGEKTKQVSDKEAAHRENVDAIPTAGGEKLGASHEGESKVIPEVPPAPSQQAGTSSTAGQPDSTTAANTAKNAGSDGKEPTPTTAGSTKNDDTTTSDKPKFFDRLKTKLHIGDKKDKA